MPRKVEIPEELKRGPFTTAHATNLEITRSVLRGERFRRIFDGVHVWAMLPDSLEQRCAAALLLIPEQTVARISHHTLAALLRLPVKDDGLIHLTIDPGASGTKTKGIKIHRREVTKGAKVTDTSFRCTTLADLFADMAGYLELVDLVALGDAIVRELWPIGDFVAAVRERLATRHQRGRDLAGRALSLVREKVDSPMETRLRLLIVFAGLPEPQPGITIHHPDGHEIGVFDLVYPEQKIVLEYDGDIHRTDKDKWRYDKSKRTLLRRLGYLVIEVRADGIHTTPDATLEEVHEALVDRRHPEVPEHLDPAWQPHFPTRDYLARELAQSWFTDPVEEAKEQPTGGPDE